MIVILCSSFVFVCQTCMKLTNIILIDSNLILVEKENAFVLFEIEIQHDIRVVFSVMRLDQGELWAGRVLASLLTESLGMTTRWIVVFAVTNLASLGKRRCCRLFEILVWCFQNILVRVSIWLLLRLMQL